jgi:hypothetical protein
MTMAPPTSDLVLETIARALAGLEQPDLSGLPAIDVWKTMESLLTEPDVLDRLRSRVSNLSGGSATLEDADRTDFVFLSKEFNARYLRLRGLFRERLVIVGHSTPQFMFVAHR